MNILILNKVKTHLIDKTSPPTTPLEYLGHDYFMHGFYWGFKDLGHTVFLNWDQSFFIRASFLLSSPKFSSITYVILKILQLYRLDRFFFSLSLGIFCKVKNINLLFSELNSFIDPNVVRFISPSTCISQWIGVFPEMLPNGLKHLMPHYDFLWNPCIFDQNNQKFPAPENKLQYIGCSVNTALFYPDLDNSYEYDVVFIGTLGPFHSDRLSYLEAIAENFESFGFWGSIHPSIQVSSKLSQAFNGWADPTTLRKVISSSKVAVNLTLNNYDRVKKGFNSRLFEIAACCGACQILPENKLINDFFQPSIDLLTFHDIPDMVRIIQTLLLNPTMRASLASNSFSKSKNYTYKARASKILSCISDRG